MYVVFGDHHTVLDGVNFDDVIALEIGSLANALLAVVHLYLAPDAIPTFGFIASV